MLTALISLVIAVSALGLILLGIVVAGIRQEPSAAELSSRAPNRLAGLSRRMVGMGIRRPDPSADADPRNTCLAGHATSDEGR